MPDYTTGTYIIRAHKFWSCVRCSQMITYGVTHFVRIKEYGDQLKRSDGKEYRKKNYYRFHLNCARHLPDLNQFESSLLGQKGVQ